MANEFIIKHGFHSKGNSQVTGSLKVTDGISGSFSGSFQGDGSDLTGVISSSYALTSSHALNTTTPTLQEVTAQGNTTDQGLIVSGSTTFNPKSTAGGKILLTNEGYSGVDNPIMTFQDGGGKNNVVIGHSANDGLINIHDQDTDAKLRTVLSSNFSAFDPGTTSGNGVYFGLTSSLAPANTNNQGYLKIYSGNYSGATAYNLQINRYNNAAGSGSIGLYGNMSSTNTAAPAIQITSRNAEKVVNLGGSSFINSNTQNNYLKYGLQIGGDFTGNNASMALTDGSLIMSGSTGGFSVKSVSSEAEIKTNNGNTTLTLGTTSSFDHMEATSLEIEGVASASKFTAISGSSGLPAYTFHHQGTTGIYSQGNGYLQFQVAAGGSPEVEITTGQIIFRKYLNMNNNYIQNISRLRYLGEITGSSSGNNLGVSASLDLVGDLSISNTTGTGAPGTGTTHSIAVTVSNPGSGNKYYLDGVLTDSIVMNAGDAYKFDQSDSSNAAGGSHPFRFSTTQDGTHNSGTEYTTGVTTNGSPGSAGAYTQISVTTSTSAPLYYYCTSHPGMGGSGQLTVDSGSLNTMAGFANITGSTNLTGSLNLADDTKLKLGNSGDLEIYHDGSNSYIDEVGTGALFYRGGTQTFQNAAGTKTMLTLNAASSVDLRFNNSTKLSTTNTGISVSNEITASGAISSSGIISMATASIGGGLFTSASLAAGGGGGGGGSAFPFAGDGVISGSLLISSSNVSGVSTASMTLQGSGSTIFEIQGSQGQLFSVTDDLIHDVFNVSDISGDTLLKVSGSGLVEVPVGPISSSGLLFISASENAGQSTYKTLVQDPATGRIYHTGSYSTGGGGGGSGETYDLNATQDGSNVDLNLTSGTGTDNSVVQLTAGSNITLTRNSATEVTIASSGGGGGGEWKDLGTTITSSKDVQITGSLIASGSVVNFASASSVLLPVETVPLINPKVEYLTISEITASGTTVPLPNSLTFVSSSAFEYLEIFINGLRLRYDIDFAPMSTSTVKYLTTIPSGSEVTYKSLRR